MIEIINHKDETVSPTETTIQQAMNTANAHVTVAKLCVEMAQEVYEENARNDAWYKAHKNRNAYVKAIAPSLRKTARGILSQMLDPNSPQYKHLSENEKGEIWEAVVNDQTIPDDKSWKKFLIKEMLV